MKNRILPLTISMMLLGSVSAFGGTKDSGDVPGGTVCRIPNVVDASLVATFTTRGETTWLKLFVPNGESSGKSYSVPCRKLTPKEADEGGYSCTVNTEDDKLSVFYGSPGDHSQIAVVTSEKYGHSTSLTCE